MDMEVGDFLARPFAGVGEQAIALDDHLAVARDAGMVVQGYRLLSNVGKRSGQEVPHLHVHIFGGQPLGPMLAH